MDRRLAERFDAVSAHDRDTQRTDCEEVDETKACKQATEPTVMATQPAHGLDTIAEGDSNGEEEEEVRAKSEEVPHVVPPHA